MEMHPILSHTRIYWAVNKRSDSKDKFFTHLNLHFFSLTTVQHWPSLTRESVPSLRLEVFQDPSEQSPVQPILTSEHTMLEAEGSTRDFLTPHGAYVFLWIYYIGPVLLTCLSWPLIMKLKKRGKVASDNYPWNQFRLQDLRDGGDDLGASAAAADTFSCGKAGESCNNTTAEGCCGISLFRRLIHSP